MPYFADKSRKIMFFHNPKCAGLSIFETYLSDDEQDLAVDIFMDDPLLSMHMTPSDIISLHNIDWFKEYYSFTTVRNPYDRLVSFWKFILKDKKRFSKAYGSVSRMTTTLEVERQKSFKEWLKTNMDLADGYEFEKPLHLVSQTSWTNYLGKPVVSKWYKVEELEMASNELSKLFGVNAKIIKHCNSTVRDRDYRNFYCDYTKSVIKQHFEEDLDLFKYTF